MSYPTSSEPCGTVLTLIVRHVLLHRLEKILSTNVTVANDNKMVAFDAWVREKYRNSQPQ